MGDFFSDLITFIVAVISHWQAYATGGVVTMAVGLFERLSGKHLNKRTYAGLFVGVFLLVSFFMAWRDEHKAVADEHRALEAAQVDLASVRGELSQVKQDLAREQDQNHPKFHGFINQIAFGNLSTIWVTNEAKRKLDGVALSLIVTIRNEGAPSIVEGWQLHLKSDKLDLTVTPLLLPIGQKFNVIHGQAFTLHREEALYEKGVKPIERGGQVRGWLTYVIEGITAEQIDSPSVKLTLDFYDVAGGKNEIHSEMGHAAGTPKYFPGTEQ